MEAWRAELAHSSALVLGVELLMRQFAGRDAFRAPALVFFFEIAAEWS
jgi:hypothetical protein